ncbi:MAG: HigA family addiction module antidote protein [Thermomicrobiales bacterium]|nr:HigA family addiction module antidote protein [Thermomicrobiales bacterium]
MPYQPVHPGEILAEDVMKELGLTSRQLAEILHVPTRRVSDIEHGRRPVTADFALRLAQWLGSTPHFWLDLQKRFDLEIAEILYGDEIRDTVKPWRSQAA